MNIREFAPAAGAVLVISGISSYLSTLHAAFDPLVMSIIFGIVLGNILKDFGYVQESMEDAVEIFLPAGIALYGAQLTLAAMSWHLIVSTFLVFAGLFTITVVTARAFAMNAKLAMLLASGLSVCGASAIAVLSPLIGARRQDTSIAVLSVLVVGLIGMIFYPILADMLPVTGEKMAFFAGSTLPMLGQVRITAGEICPECLPHALNIKIVRMTGLVILIVVAILMAGREEKKAGVPWFVVAFLAGVLLSNGTAFLKPFMKQIAQASTFCLSAGLAAVGFRVELQTIIDEGVAPLGTAFLAWGVIAVAVYLTRTI